MRPDEAQKKIITQSTEQDRVSYPDAAESLKILESAKDENGCVPMSLVRIAFRNAILEKQDRWIPVTESEPAETGLYLVTETTVVERKWTTRIRVARCEVTELNDGRIDVCWRGYGGNVLAWRPLPKIFKEEKE